VDQVGNIFTGKIKKLEGSLGGPRPSRFNSAKTAPAPTYLQGTCAEGQGLRRQRPDHARHGGDRAGRSQRQECHRLRECGLRRQQQAAQYQEGRQLAGHRPTEDNVVSGTYPIWRHLYVYVNPNLDKGEIAAYLSWIRSDAGQKYVKDIGYYPLPKKSPQQLI